MTINALRFERHIDIDNENASALDYLAEASGLSKQRLKQVMQMGAVWHSRGGHTQRVRRAKRALREGDTLHLYYDEKVLSVEPAPAQLISDEGAYSLWFKPYGMLSQGSKWGDHCTINRWAEQHLEPQRPAFIVHRLDRAATGLIMIAHSKSVAAALAELFKLRLVKKDYQVVVEGCFPQNRSTTTIDTDVDGRSALTHVSLSQCDEERSRSLLEVRIETGRKHQIRRHLSSIGFPVVGDRLYGNQSCQQDLQLTCFHLSFDCPVSHTHKEYQLPAELMLSLKQDG